MYTDEVDLIEKSGVKVLELLAASDEFKLGGLTKHIQDHLIEKQARWVQQNFIPILHTVCKLSSCERLRNHCLEIICANPHPFITSKEFPSLDK